MAARAVVIRMRRREFLALIGAAMVWPAGVRAQQSPTPIIGYLSTRGPDTDAPFTTAFQKGLNEAGYFDGKNLAMEFRWGEGQYDRLPELAADLVRRKVTLIAATGGAATGIAAKTATATIPIVFVSGGDPVNLGLVASLNRPGGNITGVVSFGVPLGAKRLELLQLLLPDAKSIALLVNPTTPSAETELRDSQAAAESIGLQMLVQNASNEHELDAAFTNLVQQRAGALLVGADGFFNGQRHNIAGLAARHSIPTMYELREFVMAGGLISYGPSFSDLYRQAGVYAGRILKGEKPADLPVQQPAKFELVINLKTAKALGLTVPPSLLARADEVIE